MRHAHVRRAARPLLLGLATAAAHAQPSPWPLDPEKLPAAITGIPPGINWPSPPLGAGPFLIESARPEHRNLRVVVVASGLKQPWSIAFLPDGDMLVTERAGRLRMIRNGVLDPNPVAGVPDGARARPAGTDGRRAAPALRREPLRLPLVPPARAGRDDAGETDAGARAAADWNGTRSPTCATSSRSGAIGTESLAHRLRPRRHALHDDQRARAPGPTCALGRSERLRRQDRSACATTAASRRTIRSSNEPATSPRSTRSDIATATRWHSIPRPASSGSPSRARTAATRSTSSSRAPTTAGRS